MEDRKTAKVRDEEPSKREGFELCGPSHLTCVDWSIPEQRKSVAASLVKGVYVLDIDRQKETTGYERLAPKWWEFFHFKCIQTLKDEFDSSIFGAIFEYKHKTPSHNHINSLSPQDHVAPSYVVAFRGTLLMAGTAVRDLYLDGKILMDTNRGSRSQIALDAVMDILGKEDPRNIWLAGHSLGATIALQTGKDMALVGCNIETYLFNPPYPSIPIELLSNRLLKGSVRIVKSCATACISRALRGKNDTDNDLFITLRSWSPNMFVNPKDLICCEYIGYFENRENMARLGMRRIQNIADKDSTLSLSKFALGKDGEASYRIPSALVTKNVKNMEGGPLRAHDLCQWWEQHLSLQSNHYQYQCNIIAEDAQGI